MRKPVYPSFQYSDASVTSFVKTPFYRVIGTFLSQDMKFDAEWRSVEGSRYFRSPKLYKEKFGLKREDAEH